MDVSFASAVVILVLVADPLGNIPVFVALLQNVEPARRVRVIVRECAIAAAVLVAFMLFGREILALLGLSDRSLNIAGGVILFLIALRMVFRQDENIFGGLPAGEPFIVPLAIPLTAGPAALATLMLLMARDPAAWLIWLVALLMAWSIAGLILLSADRLARLLGRRTLTAIERLMGLVLTAVAVQMFIDGVGQAYRTIAPGS